MENVGLTKFNWASDGTDQITGLNGTILAVGFKPGSGGAQPTDLYDLVLTNELGVDVLGGLGANLSNVNAKMDVPVSAVNSLPFVVSPSEKLNLVRTNTGGAGKTGVIWIWTR